MRKQLFSLAIAAMALLFTTGLNAQLVTPSASPGAKLETKIGLTDFHATYSRPGMKGRTLFAADGLVPYGEIWRTGANNATKFTFGGDVTIGGTELKAGDYAILTMPFPDKWEVMLYAYESGSWNSYVDKKPVATTSIKSMPTGSPVESFTIDVQNYTMEGADIVMKWGNTMAALPVTTNAKKEVMAQIERVMAGPSANDFYQAASFLSDNGDNEQALEYITKANSMAGDSPMFWVVRRQGLIEEALGMKNEAKESFTKSMKLAKAAGNMDYVRMNEKSLKMMK